MNTAVFRRELLDRLRASRTIASVLAVLLWQQFARMVAMAHRLAVGCGQQGATQVSSAVSLCRLARRDFSAGACLSGDGIGRRASPRNLGVVTQLAHVPFGNLFGQVEAILCWLQSSFLSAYQPWQPVLRWAEYAERGKVLPLLVVCAMSLQFSAVGHWISSRAASSDASLRWSYAAALGLVVLSLAPVRSLECKQLYRYVGQVDHATFRHWGVA